MRSGIFKGTFVLPITYKYTTNAPNTPQIRQTYQKSPKSHVNTGRILFVPPLIFVSANLSFKVQSFRTSSVFSSNILFLCWNFLFLFKKKYFYFETFCFCLSFIFSPPLLVCNICIQNTHSLICSNLLTQCVHTHTHIKFKYIYIYSVYYTLYTLYIYIVCIGVYPKKKLPPPPMLGKIP